MTATLKPYEDSEVLQSSLRITGAGDGLSDAMTIDPAEYHHGEKVYVVLETAVGKVTYEQIKDTDALRRVHVLRAITGTVVDHGSVRKMLDEHRRAVEKSKGVTRLPGVDDGSEDLPVDG